VLKTARFFHFPGPQHEKAIISALTAGVISVAHTIVLAVLHLKDQPKYFDKIINRC
jgi:cytochrome P450